MSCFITEIETIHDVVREMLPEGSKDERTELGRKLWNMNVDAYVQRYAHNSEAMECVPECRAEADGYVFDPAHKAVLAQCRKSVACLQYQCSEGEVPTRGLYQQLAALDSKLEIVLPLDSPKVAQASWSYHEKYA